MQDDKIIQVGEFIRKKTDDVSRQSRENIKKAIDGVREEIQATKDSLETHFDEIRKSFEDGLTETENRRATSILKTHEIIEEGIEQALTVADERIVEAVQESEQSIQKRIESVESELVEKHDDTVKALERSMSEAEQSHIKEIEHLTNQLKDQQTFEAMLTTRLEEIKDGEQGEQGEQGEPGLDRPMIEPVVINNEKDYPKNVLGTFNNGLWISTKKAIGGPENDPHAWHCILDAIATMSVDLQQDHTFKLSVRMATGQLIEDEFEIPFHEHKAIFEEGKTYKKGNWITKGHSFFQAMRDTDKAPPGNGWQQILTAPRGKEGPPGKSIEGPQGKPGRNGLDATLPPGFIDEIKSLANKAFKDGRTDSYAVTSFRGYFSPSERYLSGDVVNFDGSLFLCTSSGTYRSIATSAGAFELILGVPKVAYVAFMHWQGEWQQKTYSTGHVVRDNGWTMVAIRETNDRASPQAYGDSVWVSGLGNTPDWGVPQSSNPVAQLVFGQRYTYQDTGYLNNLRLWVDEADPNITYSVASIADPGTPQENINFLLSDISFAATGWVNIPITAMLIKEGSVFDVAVIKSDRNTSADATWPYSYVTPNNARVPVPGEIVHANLAIDTLSIHYQDTNLEDRSTTLDAIHPGDTIAGAGVVWNVISTTNNGTYYDFEVTPAVQGTDGVGNFIFTTFTDQPISYVGLPDHYVADDRVQGFYSETGLVGRALDEQGYGIDIQVQASYISDDWEVVTPSSAAAGDGYSEPLSQAQATWVAARAEPVEAAELITEGNGWEELLRVTVEPSSGYAVEFYVTAKRLDGDGYIAGKWGALISRNGSVDISIKTIYQHMEPGVRVRLTPDGPDAVFEVDGASNEQWRWRLSADVGEI